MRQRHRLYDFRIQHEREMAGTVEADRSVYFRIIVIRLSGARLVAVDMK